MLLAQPISVQRCSLPNRLWLCAREGEYECLVPPARFIDLITGASTENNSDAGVAARSVELIDALLRSSANDGAEVAVHP